MNTMAVNGYQAKITYDPDIDMFRGEILGLNGGADFYGKTTEELRREFATSLKVFLEICQERGVEPRKSYSGKFLVRVDPSLHERLAKIAAADGKSLNKVIEENLRSVAG